MKIIKHGDLERLKQVKRFICDRCGCEAEADNTEYKTRQVEYNDFDFFLECPDCGAQMRTYQQ